MLVEVDFAQCRRVAKFLKGASFSFYDFGGKSGDSINPSLDYGITAISNFYGATIALDYGFYTVEGERIVPFYGKFEGTTYKGADFLWAKMRKLLEEDASYFDLAFLARASYSFVEEIFTDDDGKLFVKDLKRRWMMLRDFGRKLKRYGSVNGVFERSEGYLVRRDGRGLLQLMDRASAYYDPVFHKKANLLAKVMERRGLWKFNDPENKLPPIDYHLQNLAIKQGLVRILSVDLRIKLKHAIEISLREEYEIRRSCAVAYKYICSLADIDPYYLDDIYWGYGRKNCQLSPPDCNGSETGEPCPFRTVCLANTEKQELKELKQPVLLAITRY